MLYIVCAYTGTISARDLVGEACCCDYRTAPKSYRGSSIQARVKQFDPNKFMKNSVKRYAQAASVWGRCTILAEHETSSVVVERTFWAHG
jgi:hypothetical protein